MQITVLMENGSRGCLCAEHGLSLYVRHDGGALLLDAGESGDFIQNAARLSCPLDTVRTAVLSHGHYDHSDGFPALFRLNSAVKVYARPRVMEPQYDADGTVYRPVRPSAGGVRRPVRPVGRAALHRPRLLAGTRRSSPRAVAGS